MKSGLFLFFILIFSFCSAQHQDSLLQALDKTNNPKEKAGLYLKLVNYFADSDSVRALGFINSAKELTSSSDVVGLASIENALGHYFMSKDTERAKQHYEKGLDILKSENSEEARNERAKLHYNLGAIAQRQGNYEAALSHLLDKSIPEAKKASNKIYLANNYLAVGLIFLNEGNLEKAIQYLQLAEKQLAAMKSGITVREYLLNARLALAELFLKKEDYEQAKVYLDEIREFLKKYPDDGAEGDWYHAQSIYYNHTGQPEKALPVVNDGLELTERTGNMYQNARLTFMKSKILGSLGRYKESSEILLNMLNDEMFVAVYGKNIATIYDDLIILEEKQGNYSKALAYANKRIALSDSINASDQNSIINEMEVKFRTAENQKELAVKELEVNKKNQYMWMALVAAFVFLGAALFTYFYFRNKKKLSEQREINLQQKLTEKEQKEQLNLTRAVLDGEERERQRVAKDLHDGLGGMLAGVKINLSTWCNNNLEENQVESFHRIINQLDSSVSELRRVARNLMPESLLNFGLQIALKDLCEFYQRPDLNIEFQALNVEKNLPLNLQINIYRIVQELLANAVKHADATHIFVQCSQAENEFFITVEDNGKGITATDFDKVKSMGLKNIKNRVSFLKGNMDVKTADAQGTSINIELNTNVA